MTTRNRPPPPGFPNDLDKLLRDLPPIPSTHFTPSTPSNNGGGGGDQSGIIVGISIGVFIVFMIGCFCKSRMDTEDEEKTNILLSPPTMNMVEVKIAPPAMNMVQVWQVDGPTMEKFLEEMAREKPVRYSALQLSSYTNNYSTELGSGGFGVVYKGQFPNGMKIAVKLLNRTSDQRAKEQFMAEVRTISRTHHLNLVRLYGFCCEYDISALVYEYMENGSLDRYLFTKTMNIGWEKLCDIAIGTAKGLAYLHEDCHQMIIHYDIKPGNVLLDANFSPKVADFGLAKLCNRDNTHISVTGYRGTPGYSAPEFLLKNYPITQKCDVYSFGMLLFEILGRRRNANVKSTASLDWFPRRVWEEYEKGGLLELTKECGIEENGKEKAKNMFMVALWCVQDCPAARPPMSSVVKMLEGGMEIRPPPEPFQYLYTAVTQIQSWKSRDSTGSSPSGGVDSSMVTVKKMQKARSFWSIDVSLHLSMFLSARYMHFTLQLLSFIM